MAIMTEERAGKITSAMTALSLELDSLGVRFGAILFDPEIQTDTENKLLRRQHQRRGRAIPHVGILEDGPKPRT